MKKSIIGLLWGESTLKVMAILYDSVITAFLLQFGLKNTQIGLLWSVVLLTQMLFQQNPVLLSLILLKHILN